MKKILYYISFFILGFFFYCLIKNKSNKIYKIGMMSGWPPFMSINKDGQMVGFDIDVVNELKNRINIPIEIVDCGSLTGLFFALENNRINAIMSGLDITLERKKKYDYVVYVKKHLPEVICISALDASSFADLINKNPIIALEGGASWNGLFDSFDKLNKIYLSTIADMMISLDAKKIDAYCIDQIQYNRIKEKIKNRYIFKIPISEDFAIDGMGIFFKKNDELMKEKIQLAINDIYQDGTIELLMQKWGICE